MHQHEGFGPPERDAGSLPGVAQLRDDHVRTVGCRGGGPRREQQRGSTPAVYQELGSAEFLIGSGLLEHLGAQEFLPGGCSGWIGLKAVDAHGGTRPCRRVAGFLPGDRVALDDEIALGA